MEQGPFCKELASLYLGDLEAAWRWGRLWQGIGCPQVRGESCVPHSWLFSKQFGVLGLEYSGGPRDQLQSEEDSPLEVDE